MYGKECMHVKPHHERRAFGFAHSWMSIAVVVGAMLGGALMRGAQPVLANYVPVIDHPLFLGGIAAFLTGTLVYLLETLGSGQRPPGASRSAAVLPEDAATGLQAAALTFVLAGATWVATRASMPAGLVLSIVATLLACVGTWFGFRGRRPGVPA